MRASAGGVRSMERRLMLAVLSRCAAGALSGTPYTTQVLALFGSTRFLAHTNQEKKSRMYKVLSEVYL